MNQELNPIKRTQWQKRLNTLLRHGQLPQEEDGAIEFWILQYDLWNKFEYSQCWYGRARWQEAEATRKYFNTLLIRQDKFFISELFKVIQDAILLISSLQDNVLIPDTLFEYILSSWMCNHCTLYHKFRIDSGRTKILAGKDTRYSLQAVNPMHKNHKDPHELDLTKPRLASYKQKERKRNQDTVYWVDV